MNAYICKVIQLLAMQKVNGLNLLASFFTHLSTSDVMQSMFYDGFKESEIFRSQDFISDLKLILKAKDFVIDLIWNNPKLALESEKNIYQLLKSCFYNNSDLNILVGQWH